MHILRSKPIRHLGVAVVLVGMLLLPLSSLTASADNAATHTPPAEQLVHPASVDTITASDITGSTFSWILTCGAPGELLGITLEGPNGADDTSTLTITPKSDGASAGDITSPGFSSQAGFQITCPAAAAPVPVYGETGGNALVGPQYQISLTQNTPGAYFLHIHQTVPDTLLTETGVPVQEFPTDAASQCADPVGGPVGPLTNEVPATPPVGYVPVGSDDNLLATFTGFYNQTCTQTAVKQFAQLVNVFLFPKNAQNFGFFSEPLKAYVFPSHTVALVAIGEVPVKTGATCTGTGTVNTNLQANAAAGSTSIFVQSGLVIPPGTVLTINGGKSNQETVVVVSYNASTGQATLAGPLMNNHAAGEPVTNGLVLINGTCFEYVGVAGAPFQLTVNGANASFTPAATCDPASGFCPASVPATHTLNGVTGPGGIATATIWGGIPGTATITGSIFTPNCPDPNKCPALATTTATKIFSIQEGATTPLVAWAGEKVVLQKFFGLPYAGLPVTFTRSCNIVAGNGCAGRFVSDVTGQCGNGFANCTDSSMETTVSNDGVARVIAESDGPGEMLVTATLLSGPGGTPINEHQFVVYFLKFEDVTLGNVVPQTITLSSSDKTFLGYLPGVASVPATVAAPFGWQSTDVTTATVNVSANELLRARVRGWFTGLDQSTRPARIVGVGSAAVETLPAGRWVLPDDWPALAVGAAGLGAIGSTASQAAFPNFRPQWDINGGWAVTSPAGTEPIIAGVTPTGPFWGTDAFGAVYATSGPCGLGTASSFTPGPASTTTSIPIPVPNSPAAVATFGLDPFEPASPVCGYAGVAAGGFTVSPGTDEADQAGAGTVGPWDPLRSYTDPSQATVQTVQGVAGLLGAPYPSSPTYGSSYLPNGILSEWDAPMPPAKVAFLITNPTQSCEKVTVGNSSFAKSSGLNFTVQSPSCSQPGQRLAAAMPGYFIPADKDLIYRIALGGPGGTTTWAYINPFYREFIPANPLIPPSANGQGYDWNSFGFGAATGGGFVLTSTVLDFGDTAGGSFVLVSVGQVPCAFTNGSCTNGGYAPGTVLTVLEAGETEPVETLTVGGANCPGAIPAGEVCISFTTAFDGDVNDELSNGTAQGPYHFWDFVNTDFSSSNASIPYTPIQGQPKEVEVYSDNHGEAMVYLNGLSSDISLSKFVNGLGGIEIPTGATVGSTTVQAIADYPYFRYFPPVASNTVTKTFTSAFSKSLSCSSTGINGIALPSGKVLCKVTLVDIDGNPIVGETVVFTVTGPGFILPTTVVSGTQPVFNGSDTQATVTSDTTGTAAVIIESTGSVNVDAFFPDEGIQRTTTTGPPTSSVVPLSYAAGWNMVGGPAGTGFSTAQAMFSWNGSAYVQVPTKTVTADCAGYFAYFTSSTTMSMAVNATPAGTQKSCLLAAGWNLVGNPFSISAALPSGVTAYYYNPTSGSYTTVSSIPPGAAVWVYEGSATSLTLTASS